MDNELIEKSLSVSVLILDGGTQSRAAISELTVDEYTDVLDNGNRWPFPPVEVFHDGSQYLVASGFHRTLAAIRHGRDSIPCVIRQGTAWDALLFGMGSNSEHGLRPSQEDRRHSVELLLDSKTKLTQRHIAKLTGVDVRTVKRIVADRKGVVQTPKKGTMSPKNGQPEDPFDVFDPFGEGEGEDGRTDSDGQDAHQEELPPRSPRNGTEESGGASPAKKRTPAEEFKIQRSKTVKTAEALVRAFDDLNRIRKSDAHKKTITDCQNLIVRAQNWT